MAVSAYDVHICLCKILKLSWKACVTISTKHPLVSFSLLCLFIVYISFPSVFWFLIYSFPLVVSTCFILSISFTVGNDEKYRDDERGRGEESSDGNSISASGDSDKNRKKSYTRVHSVRRRRAKELKRDDEGDNSKIEEKIAVTSTNFGFYGNVVDKKPLIEEIPKEIREVEVDDHSLFETTKTSSSLAPCQNPKQEFEGEKSTIKEVKDVESEEDDDDQKNVIDIGISEPERNKRLESLIARRRSRKLLSLQVRRTLINMDKNDRPGNISSIVIPKSNMNSCLSSNASGPFSPGPGSAPSVLVPMRNPFDLPYDPMEEKPDLTGDSFQQEFMPPNNNRDMMFCRHESFTLGAFFPGEFNQNRDYLVHDFGFRQKGSFQGYPFSNPGNSFDREFSPIMEQESYEENKSKSTIDIPDDDHIKEVIQVYENGVHNHSEEEQEEDTTIEVETKPTPQENSSTSSSSPSSSEENVPVFKIDKEAILKSLSSMARRNVAQEEVTESNEQIGESLSHGVSPFDTSSSSSSNRLKEQFYYSDKIVRRHAPSYSIASDLQVEVSEVSSPPLTIDENYSYQDHDDISSYDGDMEKKISWDDEDLWAGSSRLSHTDDNESRSTEVNEISDRDVLMKAGFSRINRLEDTTLSKSMEEPLNGKQYCISSSSSNADFHDSGQDHGMNMHEKIHEMFEYSLSNLHENKRKKRWNLVPHILDGNDSGKSGESCNSKRDLGESSHSIIGSSSEDSEERTEPQSEETNSDINIRPTERSENEQSSGEGSINLTALGSNDPQPLPLAPNVGFEHVPTSLISPTSVLVPRLSLDQGSLSSFDHDIEDEANNAQVLSPIALQSLAASVQESSESSMTSSTTEVDDTEFVDKHNIFENIVEQKEVACGSSHELHSREAHVERIEESNHSSFDNNYDKETEAAKSNSSLYAEEELSTHQEMVNGEATHHFSDKSTSYLVDHREENSDLHGDTGHENCSNKHVGHERKTNSTSSNYIYGTKDERQNLDADETLLPVSRLVENNDNSESCMKNEHDKRTKKHDDSLESMPVAEDKLN